ncbi:unnamed protein product, partial [Tilletia laevis]
MGQAIVSSYILPYFVDTNSTSVGLHSAMACVQRIKLHLRKYIGRAFSTSTANNLATILFHGGLLACFGPYPGAATMHVTSAWQLAWASDSVVADATEHELDVAEDVWAQLLRDFHGVEVGLTSFAVNV